MRLSDGGVHARVRLLAWAIATVPALATSTPGLAAQEPDCGDRAALRVVVLDESESIPIPGATVVLHWGGADREWEPVRETVGLDGRLVLCAPGDATRATLWAERDDVSSGQRAVELEPGASRDVELRLLLESSGTGRLIGFVHDAQTERPVAAVAVSLGGRMVAETNRNGQFILSGVPVGVHELSARHIGYAPLSHPVVVSQGVTTDLELGLVPDPVEMAPLVAMATRSRRLEVKGFYERKFWGERTGLGVFITTDDIERRRPHLISHMIADESGIRLECGMRSRSCRLVNSRFANGFSGRCPLRVYLDGMRMRSSGVIDEFVIPIEIAAVEVYKGSASVPAEFGGPTARCGAIAVWTK